MARMFGGEGMLTLVTGTATALKGAQDAGGSLGIPPQARCSRRPPSLRLYRIAGRFMLSVNDVLADA